jgi:hypothetical protein
MTASKFASTLAQIGEDLTLAAIADARRSNRRRRGVTASLACALLLAATATTAVANGWLFDNAPATRAATALVGISTNPDPSKSLVEGATDMSQRLNPRALPAIGPNPGDIGTPDASLSRVLLTNLGQDGRTLTSIPTSSGGVCFQLTGIAVQCVPRFAENQLLMWSITTPHADTVVIYGIARDQVSAVDAVNADGTTTRATLGNDAYFLELPSTPLRLLIHLHDGSVRSEALPQCSTATPACEQS